MTAHTSNLKRRKAKSRHSLQPAVKTDEICNRTGTEKAAGLHYMRFFWMSSTCCCDNTNSKALMQVVSDIHFTNNIPLTKMCAYIRNAGASESKKSIGVVTFHHSQSSSGSGDRQPRSTADCNQL